MKKNMYASGFTHTLSLALRRAWSNLTDFNVPESEKFEIGANHLVGARTRMPNLVSGFTLIETMIAVTILTFAVSGPLFTASRALVAAEIARDQLTASYLAQEGVEYVRAMRDTEYLTAYQIGGATVSDTAWSNFLNGSNVGSITQCRTTTCTLDPSRSMGSGSGFALVPCSGDTCSPLYLTNGIYTIQSDLVGAEQTPFTRTIQAIDVSSGDERIVSRVSWTFHETPYVVTVTSHLTPWQ